MDLEAGTIYLLELQREIKCALRVTSKVDIVECAITKVGCRTGIDDVRTDPLKVDVEPVWIGNTACQGMSGNGNWCQGIQIE